MSKTVTEIERAGYLARVTTPTTAAPGRSGSPRRATPWSTPPAVPASRSRVSWRAWLGTRDEAELVRLLQHAAEPFGGLEALTARRLRPPG